VNWTEELTENRIAILKEMHKNNEVTIKELEVTIGSVMQQKIIISII